MLLGVQLVAATVSVDQSETPIHSTWHLIALPQRESRTVDDIFSNTATLVINLNI